MLESKWELVDGLCLYLSGTIQQKIDIFSIRKVLREKNHFYILISSLLLR